MPPPSTPPRSLFVAYILWATFGVFGAHRYYLRDPVAGGQYLRSFGLCLIGWALDAIRMPALLRACNSETKARRLIITQLSPPFSSEYPDNQIVNSVYGNSRLEIILTALPKSFAEQFRRPLNMYFLLIACLQLWSEITPVNPLTTWGPLVFVLTLTAARCMVDDLERFKCDSEWNQRPVLKMDQRNSFDVVQSHTLRVGQVIKITCDSEFPADVVLLKSSNADGCCFVQTTNMDGECDLKQRCSSSATAALPLAALVSSKIIIDAPSPSESTQSFDATIEVDGTASVLGKTNLLLQGTHLRQCDHVIAVVVYTGPDTKLSQFKAPPVTKSSQTETLVNRISVVVFVVQFIIALSLGITGYFVNGAAASPWYLYVSSENPLREAVVYVLRFVLLISMLIPISIKVTIDAVQYLSSKFIIWDLFFSSGGRAAASARNTTISEDLGQIQYVLTDKTGTLTQNVMQLCCCSIGGSVYGDNSRFSISRGGTTALHTQPDLLAILPEAPSAPVFPMPNSESVLVPSPSLFFTALSLCNTVAPKQQQQLQPPQLQSQQQQFEYSGASPDEEAFAESCARLGFVLVGRDRKFAVLELYGSPRNGQRDSNVLRQRYNILHNFEFSSDRKMMSVLLRAPSGAIVLISKGADEVMLPLCDSASSADLLRHQQEVIDGFASSGLRTLVVACRGVSEEEYAHWLANVFHPAELQMQGREKALAQAYAKLEVGLHFLGCTGLLDALQENVSDTIHSLQQGGIKVWMLTGDKLTTAMQIAVSAGMARDTKVFHKLDSVNPDSHEAAIMALSRRALDIGGDIEDSEAFSVQSSYSGSRQRMSTSGGADAAVIFSGSTFAAMSSATKLQLVSACIKFSCVICCRLSPGQKAEIVRLVRSAALPQPTVAMRLFGMRPLERTTLAIGDGGNDVPMIQAAHCGVAVLGKEGTQAALASDFTIGDFQCLQRLLFVHGRYSYARLAYIAQFSFYKSWAFCIVQIIFAFFSNFSGSSLYDGLGIMAVNVVAFVPICAFVLHRPWVSSSSSSINGCSVDAAHSSPTSYADGNSGSLFNLKTTVGWACRAMFHGFFVSFMAMYVLAPSAYVGSRSTGMGGGTAAKDDTAVGTFILYSTVQFIVLLSDCCTFLSAPHAFVIVGYVLVVLVLYIFVASLEAFRTLSYYQATLVVLSQPMSWAVFLSGLVAMPAIVWFRFVLQSRFFHQTRLSTMPWGIAAAKRRAGSDDGVADMLLKDSQP